MTNFPYPASHGRPVDAGTPAQQPYGQPQPPSYGGAPVQQAYGQAAHQAQAYGWNPPGPGMAPHGYGQSPMPSSGNNKVVIWSIVGGVVALLILVLAPVFLIGKVSHDVGDSMESMTGGQTQQILDDELDVTLGKFSRDDNPYLSGGTLKITLKNKSDKRSTFNVEVEAVTSSGERITTASQYATNLGSGQTLNDELRFMVSEDKERDLSKATFNVISVTKY